MSHDRTAPVVHVRENSDTELEALFNFAINPPMASETTNKPLPLRMRNLPASFFRPPEPPKHPQMGSSNEGTDASVYPGGVNQLSMNVHRRGHSSPASLQQTLSAAPPPPPTSHVRQHSYDLLDEEPLPSGWDMAKTPQGQRYYLNHALQITTWNDPRKTHNATSSPASGSSVVAVANNIINNNNNNTNTSNLNSLVIGQSGPGSPASPAGGQTQTTTTPVNVENVPLPPGWERAYTADCEPYFINHIDRTTSWFHPSIPPQVQKPGMKFQQQQQANGPGEQLKQLKLQQLQMEQEILKKRQDEIARQEMALRAQVGEGGMPATPGQQGAAGELQSGNNSEMTSVSDPFFGQTGSTATTTTTDLHSRQESGDSGLGGMGTSYSLPRTPDDFLGTMEDMDTSDSGAKLSNQPSDFNGMDMGGDVTDSLNMDSEDLVASLPELNSELLKDVETVLAGNKDNPLTWL